MLLELPPPQEMPDRNTARTNRARPAAGIEIFVARHRQTSNDARSATIRKLKPGFGAGEVLPSVSPNARALAAAGDGVLTLTVTAAPGLASVKVTGGAAK